MLRVKRGAGPAVSQRAGPNPLIALHAAIWLRLDGILREGRSALQ